jgi:hypothetical protein
MRKLLLGTTALAAAATLTANAALADVSISGAYEWAYNSRSSNQNALDGTTFISDSEIAMKFSNKTDSGLTVSMTTEFYSDGGDSAIDESSITIAGGFGSVTLGQNDGAASSYSIDEMDLIAEESSPNVSSSSIGTSSDIVLGDADATKVVYHLPAMGGFTAGISHTDNDAVGGSDSSGWGARYTMDAAGTSVTLGFANNTQENTTKDIDTQNMGVKIVSGDISFVLSKGGREASDEDVENSGASLSYVMPNGMTVGAYTFKSEDDLDGNEQYTKTGAEVQYTIASGLKAFINIDDYEYKTGNAETTVADSGTNSKLTIQATF